MATLKNIFYMGSSTAARLVCGLLTFTLMARLLGPEAFGIVMFWWAVAALASLISNYGFTPYVLREIGVNPEKAHSIMSEVLSAKVLISVSVLFLSLIALFYLDKDKQVIFLFLMVSMLVDSMTDFLNVGYRATNRFAAETRIATVASVVQLIIVAGLVWYQSSAVMAALAIMVSRICVLGITWCSQVIYFKKLRPASLARAFSRLRLATAYVYDYLLQSLFGQVDSIVLNHFLGPVAVGLHQAGMRLFLGGAQACNIYGNVFIPQVAESLADPVLLQKRGERLQTAFILTGIIFGLFLAAASGMLVKALFGREFIALVNLLPWFGLLFFIRLFASSMGVLLTSAGRQWLRAKVNVFHWGVTFFCAWFFVPEYGNLGWLISLIVGNTTLGIAYFVYSVDLVRPTLMNSVLTLLGASAFLPFLHTTLPSHIP